MKPSKLASIGAAAVAISLALSGCMGKEGASPSSDAPKGPTSLVAVNAGEIGRITGVHNAGSQIGMAICEPLTGITEEGDIFMRGATSLESEDQKTWTIKVATDRKFSDGTPITAKTYVDTFNFVGNGANAMPSNFAYEQFQGYDEVNTDTAKKEDPLSGVKLVDDQTFTVTMKSPNNDVPYILSMLAFCPMPSSAFADPVAYDKNPITNGVYKLEKLDPQVEAVLVRDPNYTGWIPDRAADKIVFRVYTDTNTSYQDVVGGNADILRSLPPGLIAQGRNALGEKGLTPIDRNTLETYVTWPTYQNEKYPKEVREAFSLLVNREAISRDLFKDATAPATSMMPNSVSAYRADACKYCRYDPAAAKELIAKANFTGTIPLSYNATNTTDAAVAMAIANSAKEIGLTVEPRPVPGNALGKSINSYQLEGPVLQLWGSSFPRASEWIASVFVDANYRMKYRNDEAKALVAKAWAEKDPKKSDELWQQAEDLVLADHVLQPMYEQIMYIAHTECAKPHSAGGDMQIYRTETTCPMR